MEATTHETAPPEAAPWGRSVLRNPFVWAFVSGIIVITLMRPLLRNVPDPPPVLGQLPQFALVDSRGAAFGSRDLAGQVWVANFIFTRCASICPQLTASMQRLEEGYERNGIEGIRLLSISVDPDYDTPEVLRAYGEARGIDPARWKFLTGDPAQVNDLVVGGFKTAMGAPETVQGMIDIAHTGKFVLVDGSGGIRGYYDSDEMGLDEIYHRSQHVLAQQREADNP